MPATAVPRQDANTLVVGAGQAGLATSYWLGQRGVEHRILEQRPALGGAWQDRWDSFYLNTPNFSVELPGSPCEGTAPDGFLTKEATIGFFRGYAKDIQSPVELDTEVTRITPTDAGFAGQTGQGTWAARNVVLANAAGIDAPEAETAEPDGWQPAGSGSRPDHREEGITFISWSTGYALDFSMLDLPLLYEWNYPRHTKGVTEHPGLYGVGLPSLTRHISATLVGVGPDADHVTEHLAARG